MAGRLAEAPELATTERVAVLEEVLEESERVRLRMVAPDPSVLVTPGGASARLHDDALELRDEAGRLVVRFVDGRLEIGPENGDLVLCAPRGRVAIKSALDVEIEAGRDIRHRAARRVDTAVGNQKEPALRVEPTRLTVQTRDVLVQARTARLATRSAEVLSQVLSTTAGHIVQRAKRYDLTAERTMHRARDAFCEVTDLAEQRIGRARTMIRDTFSLKSKRTVMESSEDTAIDGKRILLG